MVKKKNNTEKQTKQKQNKKTPKSKHFKLAHNECSISVSYYVDK